MPIWGPHGEFALFAVNHNASDEAWAAFIAKRAKDILLISHLVHQQAQADPRQRDRRADRRPVAAREARR